MILTTKENVSLIAPELLSLIYGQYQKTRIYIQQLTNNTVTISLDDYFKEYTYEVQEDETIEDLIDNLIEIINADEERIINVVNSTSTYFDVIGLDSNPFNISTPINENIQEAIPASLWDLLIEDVNLMVNEETFVEEIERAQRYLMAHLLTITRRLKNTSMTTSEKVGDISVSYADPLSSEGMSLTGYGLVFRGIFLRQRRIKFTPASLKNYLDYICLK